MTDTKTTNELAETILKLRAEKYPDLPLALVERILAIEESLPDDPNERLRQIREVVEQHLAGK
jgi:hypothetical protein